MRVCEEYQQQQQQQNTPAITIKKNQTTSFKKFLKIRKIQKKEFPLYQDNCGLSTCSCLFSRRRQMSVKHFLSVGYLY
jgi:hypothetical protein